MRVVVLTSQRHESGKTLAELIDAECRKRGVDVPDYCDILIRFGNTEELREEVEPTAIINRSAGIRIAKDRVKFYERMKKSGIRTPYFKKLRWWTRMPVYVYSENGSECGNGIVLCMSREDINKLKELGFRIAIYSKPVRVAREYRVHVCRRGLGDKDFGVLIYEKIPRQVSHDMFVVRNKAKTNWKFETITKVVYSDMHKLFLDGSIGKKITTEAVKAVKACRLDFAGVDVAIDEKGKVWVFDVNTAPGIIREETKQFYKKNLKMLIKEIEDGE